MHHKFNANLMRNGADHSGSLNRYRSSRFEDDNVPDDCPDGIEKDEWDAYCDGRD